MYAVIESGGKQYRVEFGNEIEVDRLDVEPGETIRLQRVLLIADGDDTTIGRPLVEDAVVSADVLRQDRGDKIVVFKYKPKARTRVKKGHRADLTVLRIAEIALGSRSAAHEADVAAAQQRAAREAAESAAAEQAAADRALAARLKPEPKAETRRASTRTRSQVAREKAREGAGRATSRAASTRTKPLAKPPVGGGRASRTQAGEDKASPKSVTTTGSGATSRSASRKTATARDSTDSKGNAKPIDDANESTIDLKKDE